MLFIVGLLALSALAGCAGPAKEQAAYVAWEEAMIRLEALEEMSPADVVEATQPTP